jgi:hypothetical protein
MLIAAISAAKHGFDVCPTAPGKKHGPAGWPELANHNQKKVAAMFSGFGKNVEGVMAATGKRSNVVVLDLDTYKPNSTSKIELERRYDVKLPPAPTARTPHGGTQEFYRYPADGLPLPTLHGVLASCVDLQSDGALVLIPPSPGREWLPGKSLDDLDPPPLPAKLIAAAREIKAAPTEHASGPVLDTGAMTEREAWFEDHIAAKFTHITGRTHDENFTIKIAGQCPAHDDHNPSGWAGLRPDGSIHIGCSSGCEFTDLLNAFHVSSESLNAPITAKEKARLEADTLREFAKADSKAAKSIKAAKSAKAVKSTTAARDDGFMSAAEMLVRKFPPERWLVDGMLLYDGFSMLSGQPKLGKSTDARNLALCTARGIPFLGRRTEQVRTLYCGFEENPAVMTDHFKAMGARGDDLLFARAGLVPADDRIKWIEQKIIEFKPKMVILDPLSRVIRVEDWSAYGGMTAALEPFILMGQKYHCHVCIVHHESKGRLGESSGNKVLGSTALYGSVETLISVSASRGYFSIESSQRTGVNLPPTAIHFDKTTGIITALGGLREVTTQDVLAQLHEFLAKHGGDCGLGVKAIVKGIGARRGLVLDALRRGVKTGFLIAVGTGKRGSSRTYRAKILSESSAALNGNGKGPSDGYLDGLTQTAMVAASKKGDEVQQ